MRNGQDEQHELAQLNQLCDTLAMCRYLGKKLGYSTAGCDNTFRYTRAYLATYSPDVNAEEVLALLQRLGAHCDCEVGLNVCAGIDA
jgi:hypothetical protein